MFTCYMTKSVRNFFLEDIFFVPLGSFFFIFKIIKNICIGLTSREMFFSFNFKMLYIEKSFFC